MRAVDAGAAENDVWHTAQFQRGLRLQFGGAVARIRARQRVGAEGCVAFLVARSHNGKGTHVKQLPWYHAGLFQRLGKGDEVVVVYAGEVHEVQGLCSAEVVDYIVPFFPVRQSLTQCGDQ